MILRKKETEEKLKKDFQERREGDFCALCDRAPLIKNFSHWKMVENIFPYDLIASKHHMITPVRHVVEKNLTKEELKELQKIKEVIFHNKEYGYDYLMETAQHGKTIPGHFHLHLIVLHKE